MIPFNRQISPPSATATYSPPPSEATALKFAVVKGTSERHSVPSHRREEPDLPTATTSVAEEAATPLKASALHPGTGCQVTGPLASGTAAATRTVNLKVRTVGGIWNLISGICCGAPSGKATML